MSQSCSGKRCGLTLLELVIVLGILAVLSTVAVRSLEPIADQARYEQTRHLLDDLRLAICGPLPVGHGTSPSPLGGFTLDTGLFPAVLTDLSTRPPALIDRTLHSFDSNRDTINDVQLTSGWNGPYMQLGTGVTEIVDGWGRAPSLISGSGTLTILSLGSDGDSTVPETGYREDLSQAIAPQDYLGTLVFRLFEIDGLNGSRIDPSPTGTEKLGIFFYGVNADGGTAGAVEEQLLLVSDLGTFEYRRNNTLAGTVAARAFLWDDIDSDDVLDAGESIVAQSIVHYPTVLPRIETRVEMEIR